MNLKAVCKKCSGDGHVELLCGTCNGSGEGRWDKTVCRVCKGLGTQMIKCKECGGTGDSDDYEENDN